MHVRSGNNTFFCGTIPRVPRAGRGVSPGKVTVPEVRSEIPATAERRVDLPALQYLIKMWKENKSQTVHSPIGTQQSKYPSFWNVQTKVFNGSNVHFTRKPRRLVDLFQISDRNCCIFWKRRSIGRFSDTKNPKPGLIRHTSIVEESFQQTGEVWPQKNINLKTTSTNTLLTVNGIIAYHTSKEQWKQNDTLVWVSMQNICSQLIVLVPSQCRQCKHIERGREYNRKCK